MNSRRSRIVALGLCVSVVPFAVTPARAASKYWKNSVGSGNWSLGTNWSNSSAAGADNGGVPGAFDNATIAPTDGLARTINYDVTAPTLNVLTLDLIGPGTNRTVFNNNGLNLSMVASPIIGNTGRATFNQTGGTVSYSDASLDFVIGYLTGGNGIYNMSAGAISAARGFYVGVNTGTTGQFNQTGGTVNVASVFVLGSSAGSTGTYTMSNASTVNAQSANVGFSGAGTLTINSQSTASFTSGLSINAASTVQLNGGTLRFNPLTSSGLARIAFNSGTVRLGGGSFFAEAVASSLGIASLGAGRELYFEQTVSVGASGLLVNGGRLTTPQTLAVGNLDSNGVLNLTSGAVAQSSTGYIGLANATTGVVNLSDAGTRWNIDTELWVGGLGNGATLNINTGSTVHVGTMLNVWADGVLNLNGGTLRLENYTQFDNGAGEVGTFNFNHGTVQFSAARTIGTDPTVTKLFGPSPNLTAGKGLTVEGAATISSALTLGGGTLRANGIHVVGPFQFLAGTLELTGGTITGVSTLNIPTNGEFRAAGTHALRIAGAAGSTITATGNLTLGNASAVNGFGTQGNLTVGANTVTLLDANDVVFDSLSLVTLGAGATAGTINATNGLTVDFGANVTSFGTLVTPNLATKPLINNGHLQGNSAVQPLTLNGYVKGVGTFEHVNFTGTFAPGLSPALVQVGTIGFSPSSTLQMELGGTQRGSQYDAIDASGLVTLGGKLELSLINGYQPAYLVQHKLIDAAGLSGIFGPGPLLQITPTKVMAISYVNGDVFATAALPGDADINGQVNFGDLLLLAQNYGTLGKSWITGDFTGDGAVDFNDLLRLAQNYNTSLSGSSLQGDFESDWAMARGMVPEPASLAMIGALASIGFRRRR
jgi:T5SS/PEP-CTERM-associated repeat protein